MNYSLRWRHIHTCCHVTCAYYAYVAIRRTLGGTCFESCHFVNKVSGQHFSTENKQEAAECYSQHLPVHSGSVIWKIKSKSNFPVSFSLISAEMNLLGNYPTLRGLQIVNPEGLPSTINFIQNHHNTCPISRSLGRGMGCLCEFNSLRPSDTFMRR